MQRNIKQMSQRGEALSSLEDKSDRLEQNAREFDRSASSAHKRMWRKDMKMRLCIALAVVIVLIIIIVPLVTHFSK